MPFKFQICVTPCKGHLFRLPSPGKFGLLSPCRPSQTDGGSGLSLSLQQWDTQVPLGSAAHRSCGSDRGRAHRTCHSCSSPLLGTARSFTDIDSDSFPLCQEREDICTISSRRLSTLGTAVLSSSPAELLVQLMLDCSSHVSVSLISSLLLRQIYMSQSSAPTLYTDF